MGRSSWRAPRASVALAACAVGLSFVWFETLFPIGMGLDGTDLSARPGFFDDLSWLACIVGLAVGCVAAGARIRVRGRLWGTAEGSGAARPALIAGCIGALAMAAGSLAQVSGALLCWIPISGGALAGLGAALLAAGWLPGAAAWDDASARQAVVLSVAASVVGMALLGAFSRVAKLAALPLLPLLAQALAAGAMRAAASEGASGTSDPGDDNQDIERAPLLSAQNAVTVSCFFAVFFVLSLLDTRVDQTLTTQTYWYVTAADLATLALLVVLRRFLDPARLKFVLVILAATAVAAMPVSLLAAGADVCFACVKLATFFAYALSLLYIAGTVRPGRGMADSCGRALVLLGALAAAMLVGTLAGNALQPALGSDALASALVSVVLLWAILVVVVAATMGGRMRVEHVISGTFDDVSDIARTRCRIMAQQCPDLSGRELDVLELVLLGYSTPRIAQRLVISENTAKTHLRHIYAKLSVGSRQELMALAEEIPVAGGKGRR